MRIAVANLKGGVGKTTTAVYLAEAAAVRDGTALLVDSDPQGSAMQWSNAAGDLGGLRSHVVALPTADLPRRLDGIAGSYATVVIDTPPGHLGIVQAAARAGDVVLVCCQPTLMDLDRMRATIDVIAEQARPAAVLLTRARLRTRALDGARAALEAAELPVLEVIIPQRESIAAAYGTPPSGEALDLYGTVLTELEAALSPVTGASK